MERSGTFMDEQVNEEGKQLQEGSTEASGIFARAASAVASSVDASAQAMDTELKAFENASSAIPVKLSGHEQKIRQLVTFESQADTSVLADLVAVVDFLAAEQGGRSRWAHAFDAGS